MHKAVVLTVLFGVASACGPVQNDPSTLNAIVNENGLKTLVVARDDSTKLYHLVECSGENSNLTAKPQPATTPQTEVDQVSDESLAENCTTLTPQGLTAEQWRDVFQEATSIMVNEDFDNEQTTALDPRLSLSAAAAATVFNNYGKVQHDLHLLRYNSKRPVMRLMARNASRDLLIFSGLALAVTAISNATVHALTEKQLPHELKQGQEDISLDSESYEAFKDRLYEMAASTTTETASTAEQTENTQDQKAQREVQSPSTSS